MEISYDPAKREATLRERGLDFVEAATLFEGPNVTVADDRHEYGEPRFITYGLLRDRMVMAAWTPTENGARIISMRKCNDREKRKFASRMG